MEITWYGHSCFRLRGRGQSVVTDPYSPELGYTLPRVATTVVTVSHQHEHHNYVRALRGRPHVIAGPGEYEVGGIFVIGVNTSRFSKKAQEQVQNTAYLIEFENITICHLGSIANIPSQEQVEQFNDIDILLVPVGGRQALSGTRAAEVVSLLEPKIVIPMQYKVADLNVPLETTRRFLAQMAVKRPKALELLKISKAQLPDQTKVVLLEPRR